MCTPTGQGREGHLDGESWQDCTPFRRSNTPKGNQVAVIKRRRDSLWEVKSQQMSTMQDIAMFRGFSSYPLRPQKVGRSGGIVSMEEEGKQTPRVRSDLCR